ncbi:non-ribosomal peptide synthetase [Pseudomonas sp. DTU12.3]|uniref:non-ribosomal peptide synthetase n=1 Tax=Pseudomonas sp. DTU12.3 TaxID=2073078 RepID=UPI00101194F2|nr:non-ribosomal peptide synthetase [Pseudomonas sp. DTU12.3]QAX84357.1 non-ribosomal peptide synthetase [Pseudomonas sp. DTU12.3]
MDINVATRIARRFITLPLEKRKEYLGKMLAEGVSPANLPIPEVQSAFASLGLSYAQERQWFLWQLEPGSAAYHIPMALRLRGQLDVAALQRSFDSLIERHQTLRTVFVHDGERPQQEIRANAALTIVEQSLAADTADGVLQQLIESEIQQPFDLAEGPLLRVKLLHLGADDHVLILIQHHIVSDGWSMRVMVDELIALYAGFSSGTATELATLPIQYADYALWQRSWMEAGERERQLAYWLEQLGGEQPVLELPQDRARPALQSYRGARLDLEFDEALNQGLQAIARREGVTLFMVLLAAFQTFLHRYSGQADIRVGVPNANRNRTETEGLIGYFVNTQVMRAQLDPRLPFNALLQQVKQAAMGAQAHQELPFEQLVEALAPERSLSRSPLFQVMFNHQTATRQQGANASLAQLQVEPMSWDTHQAQLDLTLETHESADSLGASLIYATDLFDAATIARMGEHLLALLQAIVAQPQQAIGELPMLTAQERQAILLGWNDTVVDYPLTTSVQQLIEAQVAKTPDAPALAFGDTRLSYAQLNARANRLAHRLIESGVGPESLVGIAVERSIEMVVGLLAVLKAGGAYVPLDPEYPPERLRYMLEDSGVKLLLTQAALLDSLPLSEQVQTLALDSLGDLQDYPATDPQVAVDAENLAYVIYTSGSTGKPKGAGNRHAALTNRLCWMQQAYQLGAGDTVLQKTPFSFDVSVWEFFWPLMTGARLVVAAPGDHRDPATLVALINREQVTTLHFVPSMLQAFLQDEQVATCGSLKRIVCSGEALPADAQLQVFAKLPQAGLFNLYGPTEAAIDVTHWTCVEEGRDSVPIGEPIANLACYILDDELQPVPVGVLGELYLAGVGLARGYHQRPALTAERFAVSPYGHGERIYRTGDLARYRDNGVIEYAGRIDHQVKLRGLRIEMGEIEARLLEHPAVREAVVLVIDGKQLVAYVVLAEESADWRQNLAAHVQQQLPEYMVPTQWLALAQMPLSPNGKLDRKALPKPDASVAQQQYQAPGNAIEQQLADIWQSVLGLEQIGVSDNFFALGGDSIISIQVVSRARQAGLHFTPKDLFQHQTIRGLASVATVGDGGVRIDQNPVTGSTPLLPFQQLFFETDIPQRQHWNQSLLLKPAQALHGATLEQALQALVSHHDALRLTFTQNADGWSAAHRAVEPQQTLLWQTALNSADEVEAACEEAQRSLDLHNGPLLRGMLLSLADGSQRLLLVIHHLAVDGVSWRVLLEDLQDAYRQLQDGQPLKLPAKTSAFKHWAEGLQAHTANLAGELDFWRGQLLDAPQDLPRDNADGRLANNQALSVRTQLDKALTRKLLQQAPAAYRTQVNDLLLTALARVICRWTGDTSALIQLEGHGREELIDGIDLSRTVGWFTSLYPVRLTPQTALADAIKQVKEQLRAIPNKGLGFGALRYLGDDASRAALAAVPQARITFNYLGQFDSQFDEAALFVPAAESAGREQSPLAPLSNWLEVSGQVYGAELKLSWTFSREMFNEATIQQLADDYAVELTALVEHCCAPGNHGITPSDFPLATLTQAQLDGLPLAVAEIEDIYPLSPMQQGMLFHTLSDDGDDLYINQINLPVDGMDPERFRRAWQHVIGRHAILRTSFHWQGGQTSPIQVVQHHAEVDLQVLDWRGQDIGEQRLAERAHEERARGFELHRVPLQRLLLIRTGEDSHQLIWTSHHILMDGWSSSQLFGEVLQHYASGEVVGDSGRYRDFIEWLQSQDQDRLEQFWRGHLQTLAEPTALSQAMHPRHVATTAGHAALYTKWDEQQTRRLQQHCRAHGMTANTLIQGAWLLVLQRYTGQSSVAFGATVAGRPEGLANADSMLGLFINTLPVIQTLQPAQRLSDWLAQLQAYNLDLRDHAHAPLADIQRWSGQGGQMLFDSIIVFENYPIDRRLEEAKGGLRFGSSASHDVTNFPMDLAVHLNEELSIEYLFLRDCFSVEAVERIRETMEITLQAMLDTPHEYLGNLQRLAPQQWQALQQWGAEPAPSDQREWLPLMIAEHARIRPQANAVECAGEHLSYAELEARANRLAHHLIASGAGPEVLIGVALERSLDMLVALLAVFKSGAAYVPLDIDYPRDRLAFMIEDSGMSLMISRGELSARLPLPQDLPRVDLDNFDAGAYAATAPQVQVNEDTLAYLIYTSGSTGLPKGVAVTHGPLSMHCQAICQLYEMDHSSRELHFMSFAFDGAHERWLTTLAFGGTLVLRDNELWTPEQTCHALQTRSIDIACFPPAYLKQVAEYVQASGLTAPKVRIYCLGGDAVPEQTLQQVRSILQPQFITNGYGPTETVVTPMLWKAANDEPCAAAYAPIGRVVGQRSLWVLDDDLNPLPAGLSGQLHIGGYGVARGYHGRPAVTAERFVPDPFGAPGSRLYRSGDLVRLRESGVMDYVGRADHQVKVRGFRIELGEIEACLRLQEDVTDAVVIARDGVSGKQLIGYVVADCADEARLIERLKTELRTRLPDYMVPAQIMCLTRMPISPNGKLDRKALPEPQFQVEQYVAPRTEEEALLAQIWAEVLQVEQVGLSDNFFELGGDSILSLQVISRARNHPQLKLDLKLRDLMRYQTIGNLFDQQVVNRAAEEQTQVVREGAFPLIPIQQWFFDEEMNAPHHFNQALILRSRQALDAVALEKTLMAMLMQHDALRLRFVREGGVWTQHYQSLDDCRQQAQQAPLLWVHQVADKDELEVLANQAQRSLNLSEGPLVRGLLATLPDGEARLLLVIHHLVIDGVSWRVLLQDLQTAYDAYCLGEEPQLPVRTSSFRDWAEHLSAHTRTLIDEELDYWLQTLDQPGKEMRCDNPRGKNLVRHRAEAVMNLDETFTASLLKQAPAVYQTQINDLLLTALGRVLCRWNDDPSVLVQLEGHGREDLFEDLDLSRTMGWFTTMFPVRLAPGHDTDMGEAIVTVRDQLQNLPNKGVGYGALRHMAGAPLGQRLAALPQARVTFNYLGQFDQSFDEQALLVPADDNIGDSYDMDAGMANWLELVGQVYNGRLAFRCIYSTRRYRTSTVERLMADYQNELQALIDHCLAQPV